MTTTSMSMTTQDAPAQLERLARRLCALPETWTVQLEHYVGDVRVVVTTPLGVPLPPDAGKSPAEREVDRLELELQHAHDALTQAQVEAEAAAAAHAAELASRDEQYAQLADQVAARTAELANLRAILEP